MSELLHSAKKLPRIAVKYDFSADAGWVDVTGLSGTRKPDHFTNAAGIEAVYHGPHAQGGLVRHRGVGVLTGCRTIEVTNDQAVLVRALRSAGMDEVNVWQVDQSIPTGAEIALLYLVSNDIRPLYDAMTFYYRSKGEDTFYHLTTALNITNKKKPNPDGLELKEVTAGKGKRVATTSLTTNYGPFDRSTRLTFVAPKEIPMSELLRALKRAGKYGFTNGADANSLGYFLSQRYYGLIPPGWEEQNKLIDSMRLRRFTITH